MKLRLSLCFLFFAAIVNGQWKESFHSVLDNAWIGDRSHFMINPEQQLQLSATAAGNSILIHPFDTAEILNWTFYFKMQFAPSASNRLTIYLMTDRLLQDSANSYLLEIGENGNNDNWKFYRKNALVKTLLTEGSATKLAGDPAQARTMIQKNETNQWSFSTDYSGNKQFILEQIVQDSTPLNMNLVWFGWQCYYTDTRKDNFFLDDICIGPPLIDLNAPQIIQAIVLTDFSIQIEYNEEVDSTSALDSKNYLLDGVLGPLNIKKISSSVFELEFDKKFINAQNYILQYDGIRDRNGNISVMQSIQFVSKRSSHPVALDILITEIMADPSPVVGLPEKEYVEIKNIGSQPLDLMDCILTDGSTQSKLPKYILDTNSYLILCHVRDTLLFKTYGNVLGLSSFPSLNNTGDLVSFRNKNQEIVFEVNYEDSWYGSTLKKEGGYSLELKNSGLPCAGKENWTGSNHFSGGTPGFKNSVEFYLKDQTGPVLLEGLALNEFEVKLTFNEKLLSSFTYGTDLFSIIPFRTIASVELLSPSNTELLIVLNEALDLGKEYTLEMKELPDCLGNTFNLQSTKIALAAEPAFRDLVWSEVLFNPYSGGSDFVEIYNRSHKILSLQKLLIKNAVWNDSWISVASEKIIKPGSYLAITPDPSYQLSKYPKRDSSRIVSSVIPSIDDDGGNLQLAYNKGNQLIILDSFTFSRYWHHPFIRDVEGVSLEKINMEHGSDNRNNWQSAAASFGYATPGLQNSHYVDLTKNSDQNKPYSLSSRIISPNGDSYRDFLSISFELNKPAYKSRIEIYDLSGQKLKSLAYQVLSTNDLLVWNADDDEGALLPIGNYILYIELLHPEGELYVFKERITVDY